MFRLLRSLIGLAALGLMVYAAVAIPLGEKTFWQHLKAIAGSEESKQLVKGVKGKAGELFGANNAPSKPTPRAKEPSPPGSPTKTSPRGRAKDSSPDKRAPPLPTDNAKSLDSREPFSPTERQQLRKMIRRKNTAAKK
jgi:hypothetical protein